MKIAIIFPGIGYNKDKPVLYYSIKIAKSLGYEIREVSYQTFNDNIMASFDDSKKACEAEVSNLLEALADINFEECEDILFISKSLGTIIASGFAKARNIDPCHIYFTPIPVIFDFIGKKSLVFIGTKDHFDPECQVPKLCERLDIPCHVINDGNHSLETGNISTDLSNLQVMMNMTREFLDKDTKNV